MEEGGGGGIGERSGSVVVNVAVDAEGAVVALRALRCFREAWRGSQNTVERPVGTGQGLRWGHCPVQV